MSVDIWKVFHSITLIHPCNFAFENIALNQLPGGPDGPDPPDGAGAAGVDQGRGPRIRSSSGGQDEAIEPPTVVPGALVRPVHHVAYSYVSTVLFMFRIRIRIRMPIRNNQSTEN